MSKQAARGVLIGLAVVVAGLATAATALPADDEQAQVDPPLCHGEAATIVGSEGDDVLRGTPSRDVIWAGSGDDEVHGGLGSDVLCGGPGSDVIHGGRGNDDVDGGAGDRDRVIGDLGDDKVLGGPGDFDEVAGDLGIDIVNGGPGDFDLVHGDYGWDRMSGGAGKGDIASFATDVSADGETGVWASLAAHKALGDGRDKLLRFESLEGSAFGDTLIGNRGDNLIDGGPGDDKISGKGGRDTLIGGQGSDGCRGAKGRTTSCGGEAEINASAYVALNPTLSGGAGLQVLGGRGPDDFVLAYDEPSATYRVSAEKGIAIGPGCLRPGAALNEVWCPAGGAALWLTADLGPGRDTLRVAGSLLAVGNVRIAGGYGDDVIHGGPEDDLIEAGRGADRLYGHAGADGLVGGLPGPTFLFGGEDGDLLAAGGGCAGGALVGGPGRDNASFAETGTHPGILLISLPRRIAYIDVIEGCKPVRISATNEQLEGSFGDDVIVGDRRDNSLLGQPGRDRFYGNGGDDVIDARDGVRDLSIRCGPGGPGRHSPAKPRRRPAGFALTDAFDPAPVRCGKHKIGTPIPGLPH